MPHLALFGAGPALGLSTAQRFGRAGYSVTLIARNTEVLGQLERQLTAAGVTVDHLVADLTDTVAVTAALDELHARHGLPDAVVYSPGDVSRLPVNATALDLDTLRSWLPLHLLTPVHLLHTLLPAMTERGSGAALIALGSGARQPQSALASVNVPQSGLLTYLHTVNEEVRPHGVRVGGLLIGRLIERSAAARLVESGHFDEVTTEEFPRVHPDELAEELYLMATTDTEVERAA
ncbi:SDR family NAD(P)-dependent oxidoreductase [Nocardia sp. NPDC057668]|uniref:SDR family NAD(P)-dependent oxidoreductase n=1 Tax=Nocardia sp. NPDC057668 TaxID=3346202 RepID=UPI00366E8734